MRVCLDFVLERLEPHLFMMSLSLSFRSRSLDPWSYSAGGAARFRAEAASGLECRAQDAAHKFPERELCALLISALVASGNLGVHPVYPRKSYLVPFSNVIDN